VIQLYLEKPKAAAFNVWTLMTAFRNGGLCPASLQINLHQQSSESDLERMLESGGCQHFSKTKTDSGHKSQVTELCSLQFNFK